MNGKIALLLAAVLTAGALTSCGMRDAAEKETKVEISRDTTTAESTTAPAKTETKAEPAPETTAPTEAPIIETEPAPVETLPPETEPAPVVTEPPVTEPPVTEPETTAATEPVYVETTPAVAEPVAGLTQIDGVTYVNGILVANKTYALPADYNPGVSAETQNALDTMFAAAAAEGLSLWVRSGVRTYNDQYWQYNVYVQRDGQALADTYSARPGHSEHQSGLGFDINSIYKSFADTAEGQWLAANCHKYGFIIRYPAGKEHITGYMYEPWHIRYLGVDVATAVYESGLCLEEYLGITSAYAN